MKRRILFSAAIMASIVGLFVAHDVYQDRNYSIYIIRSTPLLSEPYPLQYKQENTTLKALEPKEHVKVLRITYGKDYMAIRVSSSDGQTGYVISDENIKLHKNK